MTCGHCRAKRACLHAFSENGRGDGVFEVVRCLLCGWQICRLIPRKQRELPAAESLLLEEPDELELLEARFLNFAPKALKGANPYRTPFFLNGRN
jgi:hypothetical protein